MNRWIDVALRTLAPLLLALATGGLVILALGADPLAFYADALRLGTVGNGWQQTLTAMAPLLLVALGLIIAFRAQLWNLGYSGTYLLSAAVVAGIAPDLFAALPFGAALLVLLVVSLATGAAVVILPALLKAVRGTNEVITSLMMSFIAISLANLLVKGPFQDATVSVPQTQVLDLQFMLPFLPGTRVHAGFALALGIVIVFHFVLTRSSFGLRIDMLGASPRAAAHAGVDVKGLIVAVFLLSGGMIALAGAVDMLGLWGYTRTNWNPGYGDKILPFVFLARLNPLGSIPLVGFYALLSTGGTIAAQRAGLSVDVLLVIVALVLFFMVLIEYLGTRWNLGRSYLRRGLFGRGQRGRGQRGGQAAATEEASGKDRASMPERWPEPPHSGGAAR
ncbi:MAG: ABC transporter permease [Leucobacter sp.]